MTARLLYLDLETFPILAYVWGLYQQDAIDVKTNWYIASFAYKWENDKKITVKSLPDYSRYNKNMEDDSALCRDLWDLYDQASVVVAHNGDRFDIRKSNARFIVHGFEPPSPYKSVDTLKIAKRNFAFSSNRLNALGDYFGFGRKLPHTGWDLWKRCLSGDRGAWATMKKYNVRDVELLEKVYLRLRPWHGQHPNMNERLDEERCPVCRSNNVQRRGVRTAIKRRYARLHCQACGHWYSGEMVKI